MLYSHDHKFVYLCPPKTASTSVTEVLMKEFGAEWHEDRHDNHIPAEMKDYFTFASIRHPYLRAISGYSYIARRFSEVRLNDCWDRFHMISLTDYFKNLFRIHGPAYVHNRTQDFVVSGSSPRIDAYVRAESLEADFSRLPFVNKPIAIPKLNVSSTELSEAMIRRICVCVAMRYASDFHNYQYDFSTFANGKLPIFC